VDYHEELYHKTNGNETHFKSTTHRQSTYISDKSEDERPIEFSPDVFEAADKVTYITNHIKTENDYEEVFLHLEIDFLKDPRRLEICCAGHRQISIVHILFCNGHRYRLHLVRRAVQSNIRVC
jgi:hypothetical protein